jgi:hypothetical protein
MPSLVYIDQHFHVWLLAVKAAGKKYADAGAAAVRKATADADDDAEPICAAAALPRKRNFAGFDETLHHHNMPKDADEKANAKTAEAAASASTAGEKPNAKTAEAAAFASTASKEADAKSVEAAASASTAGEKANAQTAESGAYASMAL